MQKLQITAPVLIPFVNNCKMENPLTKERIKGFKEQFDNYNIIDAQHQIFNEFKTVGYVDNSYISRNKLTYTVNHLDTHKKITYPAGTWFLDIVVTDENVISKIKNGEYTGLSAGWTTQKVIDEFEKYEDFNKIKTQKVTNHDITTREVTLDEIINPICFSVSIVDKPCFKNCIILEAYDLSESKVVFDSEKENGDKMSKILEFIKAKNAETENNEDLAKRVEDLELMVAEILETIEELEKRDKAEDKDDKEEKEEEKGKEAKNTNDKSLAEKVNNLETEIGEIKTYFKGKANNSGSKSLNHHNSTKESTEKKLNEYKTFLDGYKGQ